MKERNASSGYCFPVFFPFWLEETSSFKVSGKDGGVRRHKETGSPDRCLENLLIRSVTLDVTRARL